MTKLTEMALDQIHNPISNGTNEVDANLRVLILKTLHRELKKPLIKYRNELRQERHKAGEKCSKLIGKFLSKLVCEPIFSIVEVVVQVPYETTEIISEAYEQFVNDVYPTKLRIKHEANLSSLQFELKGNHVTATADIDYWIELGVKQELLDQVKMTVDGITSCGLHEDLRRIRFVIEGDIIIGKDASVQFIRSSKELKWVNECKITAANIELSDILSLPIIEKQFDKAINKAIDKLPSEYQLKPKLEQAWAKAQEPISIGDDIWIQVNPENVWLRPISGNNGKVSTGLGLKALPIIYAGEKPSATEIAFPAQIDIKDEAPYVHLITEGRLTLTRAEEEINKAISSMDLSKLNQKVVIEKIILYSGDNNRIIIGVSILKPFKATIYLEGQPVYDEANKTINLSALDFTLDTKNYLLKTADWLVHSTFKTSLQQIAHWHFDSSTENLMSKFKDFDKDLGIGRLQGTIDNYKLLDIKISKKYIQVFLEANGKAIFNYEGLKKQ